MHRSSSQARPSVGDRRLLARGLALAAVVGIAMLGNLRSHAAEAGRTGPAPDPARSDVRTASRLETRGDIGVAGGDEFRLVPAIYAWNPDVRFIYFRHVSKWM